MLHSIRACLTELRASLQTRIRAEAYDAANKLLNYKRNFGHRLRNPGGPTAGSPSLYPNVCKSIHNDIKSLLLKDPSISFRAQSFDRYQVQLGSLIHCKNNSRILYAGGCSDSPCWLRTFAISALSPFAETFRFILEPLFRFRYEMSHISTSRIVMSSV